MSTSAAASKICLPANLLALSPDPRLQAAHWRSQLHPQLQNLVHRQHLLPARRPRHQCLARLKLRKSCLSNDHSRPPPLLLSAQGLRLLRQQRARSRSWASSSQRAARVRSHFHDSRGVFALNITHPSLQEHRLRRTAQFPIPAPRQPHLNHQKPYPTSLQSPPALHLRNLPPVNLEPTTL